MIKNWDSRWFAEKGTFGDTLVEDYNVRNFILKELNTRSKNPADKCVYAGVPKVEIERFADKDGGQKVRIHIHCAKPGIVIGRGGADIEKLLRPILERKADMVIGERPIDETEHFSWKKKKFQHLGSWVVRVASKTDVPDAPSGFRAYSRETAMRMNVVNEYTYTLETIIQAGKSKMAVTSVPIRTNPETRPSRLFSSMWRYMKRSASVILRSTAMYRPMHFFGVLGTVLFLLGLAVGIRFLVFFCMGAGGGHVQSLILAAVLMMIGFQTITIGLLGDTVAANRKILEDVQYHVRKMDYDSNPETQTPDDVALAEENKS